jgi:hypothetical protein
MVFPRGFLLGLILEGNKCEVTGKAVLGSQNEPLKREREREREGKVPFFSAKVTKLIK